MPNRCSNNVVVTGAVEDIAHFKRTCVRLDGEGESSFDFNSLIPMPTVIEGTVTGRLVDDALLVLGRDDLVKIFRPLEELMRFWKVTDIEALKEKIGPKAFENARQSIEAFELTGAPNRYVWANMNWGTEWNASDFKIIKEEPGRYEFYFNTEWSPPEPVYMKLAERFPNLCFEIDGGDDHVSFDFQATVRYGAFNIQYRDPDREALWTGMDSDQLLDFAKSYCVDPTRFLCVGLCRAVTSNDCHRCRAVTSNDSNSGNEDPECEKAVAAWASGDTKEDSEKSCREFIARHSHQIKTLVTDWQFTIYAPGEIQFQEPF